MSTFRFERANQISSNMLHQTSRLSAHPHKLFAAQRLPRPAGSGQANSYWQPRPKGLHTGNVDAASSSNCEMPSSIGMAHRGAGYRAPRHLRPRNSEMCGFIGIPWNVPKRQMQRRHCPATSLTLLRLAKMPPERKLLLFAMRPNPFGSDPLPPQTQEPPPLNWPS